jgi:hypothetical protein
MSLTAVNVVYGGNQVFEAEVPASDGKQEWVNTDFIVDMKANTGTLNPGGAIFRYCPPNQAYASEYRVSQTPTAIAPSDVA